MSLRSEEWMCETTTLLLLNMWWKSNKRFSCNHFITWIARFLEIFCTHKKKTISNRLHNIIILRVIFSMQHVCIFPSLATKKNYKYRGPIVEGSKVEKLQRIYLNSCRRYSSKIIPNGKSRRHLCPSSRCGGKCIKRVILIAVHSERVRTHEYVRN